MKFLSVCSGIEAASVAWDALGWKAVAFSEIEPFPCAVLAHHFPDTPNFGDMTKFKDWPDELSIDLLCGGTPCQSFSVAGLRKGLDDPRGNLMLVYGAIAAKYRPRWLVWENVPGVLSSNEGRDFASFLGLLTGQVVDAPPDGWGNSGIVGGIEDAYGLAYRVLDAQYFGVPQRRRRVFVVGHLGDWRAAAAVLFERHSLQGHPAPRRETGQSPAGTLSARTEGGGGLGTDFELGGGLLPQAFGGGNTAGAIEIATCLTHHGNRQDFDSETFIARSMGVRRLTPRECERLQGYGDNYTLIPNKAGRHVEADMRAYLKSIFPGLTDAEARRMAADGPRYKALGNSWAVPCARWLGQRINIIEKLKLAPRAEKSASPQGRNIQGSQ